MQKGPNMKVRLTVGVMLSLFWTSFASAQVTLEQKFPENTKYKLHVEQKTSQRLTLAGMNLDTNSTVLSVETRSIGKRASDGTLPIGKYVVTVNQQPPEPGQPENKSNQVPKKYISAKTSGLEFEVTGGANVIDITLEK